MKEVVLLGAGAIVMIIIAIIDAIMGAEITPDIWLVGGLILMYIGAAKSTEKKEKKK